jgi:signal transduction histidine kinase
MKTLRSRLILSHILPVLIVLPVLGIALTYIIETQVVLASLTSELEQQAAVAATAAATQPDLWQNSQQAQIFVTRFSAANQTQINLIDPTGALIASANPADADKIGQLLNSPNLQVALAGSNTVQANYTLNLQAEVIEVLIPVTGANRQVVGVVRLARDLSTVYDRFVNLRYLTAFTMLVALLLAGGLGLLLALNLEKSLSRVAQAIYNISTGHEWTTLPEQGPAEVRLLLRAFNNLIERLRGLEEARRRLLANLVHEVGRPVGAVKSAVHALLNGADEEPALRRDLLTGMEAEIDRLQPLLENLANLHSQVLGTLELQRHPIDLSDWLPKTVIPWREAAHEKGLHWEMDIPPSLPMLNLDPDRMAQVLGNLLSNAIKYTPAGGSVTVSAGVTLTEVWVTVADTGIGISPNEQTHVLEPFYRTHPGRRFPQGMGLGLTIAHELTTAHGGRLDLSSSPKKGSQFTIRLPLN